MRRLAVFLSLGLLAACAEEYPTPGGAAEAAQAAPYPALVPLDPILGQEAEADEDPAAGFQSRLDRLRARAAAMRGRILTDDERDRLEHGVTEG